MPECPTCGRDDFESDRVVKIHHKKVHGESIAGVELICEECGDTYRVPPSTEKRGSRFCSRDCQTTAQSREFSGEGWHLTGVTGASHPKYTGNEDYYGENWPKMRRKALERDGRKCRICGLTREEHLEEHGCGLHVHHVRPIASYETQEEANELDNLVTICRPCHVRWEGIPVFPKGVGDEADRPSGT